MIDKRSLPRQTLDIRRDGRNLPAESIVRLIALLLLLVVVIAGVAATTIATVAPKI